MSRLCELISLFQLFVLDSILGCSSNTIDIPQGKIQGLINYSDNYNAYLGIPYATVGERFQGPGPAPHWNGTRYSVNGSINCEQIDSSTQKPTGQKDCLVLNVFTPLSNTIKNNKELLPVLIYIHGGGFHVGFNVGDFCNPKYLLKKEIIVVTFNYRLGAFGFLCLQTPEVPGNSGLKDQVAAIRWVKNNIQYFGGDPQSITLSGVSAGAAALSYLLLSSETEGLFQHVILASGSLLVPFTIDNDPIESASRVATKMGYTTKDPQQLIKIFRNASSDDILKATHFDSLNNPFEWLVFRPCIDKSKDSLLKRGPRELISSTLIEKNVSITIGCTNKEGIEWAGLFDDEGLKNLTENFSKIIPPNIIFATEEEKTKFVDEVKNFYFKNETVIGYDLLVNYFSDMFMMYPAVATTQYLLRSNVSVYNYYFQYDSNRNMRKSINKLNWMKGATHTDDLQYIFDPPVFRSRPVLPTDAAIIDAMTSFWSNIVKTGNPSTKEILWKPSNRNDMKFLSIDKKIEMIPQPHSEGMRFWQEVYEKYNSF